MEICAYIFLAFNTGILVAILMSLKSQYNYIVKSLNEIKEDIPNRYIAFNGNGAGKLYKKKEELK